MLLADAIHLKIVVIVIGSVLIFTLCAALAKPIEALHSLVFEPPILQPLYRVLNLSARKDSRSRLSSRYGFDLLRR